MIIGTSLICIAIRHLQLLLRMYVRSYHTEDESNRRSDIYHHGDTVHVCYFANTCITMVTQYVHDTLETHTSPW